MIKELKKILKKVDIKTLRKAADIYCVRELWKPPKKSAKKSAVLLLIIPQDEPKLVLIRRTIDNSPHSGQIALPGGQKEFWDLTLKQTALREAKEEVGIKPKNVKIIGKLAPIYVPVSNFWIYPYIGFLKNKQKFNLNKSEIDEIYFLPLSILKYFQQPEYKELKIRNKTLIVPGFSYDGIFVWGATAKILSQFGYVLSQFLKK